MLLLVCAIFTTSLVYAQNNRQILPITVAPQNASGSLKPNTNFSYNFVFSTNSNCNPSLLNISVNITTDARGLGATELNITSLSTTPNYMCEYLAGTFRKAHTVFSSLFENRTSDTDILAMGYNHTSQLDTRYLGINSNAANSNQLAGQISTYYLNTTGSICYTNGTGCPGGQSYTNGSGLILTGNQFNLSTAYLDAIYSRTTLMNTLGNWSQDKTSYNTTAQLDLRYATIGSAGGNTSWNQTLANSLYYSINNPFGFYNSSTLTISVLKTYGLNTTAEIKTLTDSLYASTSSLNNYALDSKVNSLTNLTLPNIVTTIGNWSDEKINYYNTNNTYNKTEIEGMIISKESYFFKNYTSDYSNFGMNVSYNSTENITTITANGVSDTQIIASFITRPGKPNSTTIYEGKHQVIISGTKIGGGKRAALYYELYTINAIGTEKLIYTSGYTSDLSSITTKYTIQQYYDDILLNSTDRLEIKIRVTTSGGGGSPTVAIDIGGSSASRYELPSTIAGVTEIDPVWGADKINYLSNNTQGWAINFSTDPYVGSSKICTATNGACTSATTNTDVSNSSQLYIFDDLNYAVATYNRITTALTINVADADVPSSINIPSAASIWGNGGLVMLGNPAATNTAIINASKMMKYTIRAKQVAVAARMDLLGEFKSGTTLAMNSSITGIVFAYNVTSIVNGSYWHAAVCNAGTCTIVNTTIIGDTNWHTFQILGNNQSGISTNYSFYIDGTYRAGISTNIPTTMLSTTGTWIESTDATADTLRANWIEIKYLR